MNIEDIQDKMRDVSITQDNILRDLHDTTEELSQTQQLLNKTRQELDVVVNSDVNITVSIDKYIDQLFIANSTHAGHTYLVSRPMLDDVLKFNSLCMIEGGYLVEIDDAQEFNFVSSFFTSVNSPWNLNLMIGMTDFGHQGTWKYINSGKKVTYFNWYTGQPSSSTGYDCAFFGYSKKKMYSYYCRNSGTFRFMCEIP